MNNIKIRILLLLLLIFILVAINSIYTDINSDQKEINNIKIVKKYINKINLNSNIITHLQKERVLASIYSADSSAKHYEKFLNQRMETDKVLDDECKCIQVAEIKEKRLTIINAIDLGNVTVKDSFLKYTDIINTLMIDSEELIFSTMKAEIKNELILYNDLNKAKEALGKQRIKIGVALASRDISDIIIDEIYTLNILFHNYINELKVNRDYFARHYLNDMFEVKCLKESRSITRKIMSSSLDDVYITPMKWFDLSTCAVDTLDEYINKELKNIDKIISAAEKKAKTKRLENFLSWFVYFLIVIAYFIIIYKHSKELKKKQIELQHYKDAIDFSAIVSKSDAEGIITYVNDAFCKISEYTREELIGSSHNIIRHPDMPKEIFEEMWETIQTGEKWKGVVKNRAKSGKPFWVEAFIVPIRNDQSIPVEYIAIRTDITKIVLLSEEIKDTQREIISRLGQAVETRSKESGYHIRRVSEYSRLLAQLAGLSKEDCEIVFAASSMHDVGKIAIPDEILLKPGPLVGEEWKIMKTHTEIGYKILESSERPILKAAAVIAYEHHEHYNGNGYPQGISGEKISIFGRIVAIVDVFDALASDRVYKKAWKHERIVEMLEEEAGKQFDPKLIKLFLDNIEEFLEIKNKFKDRF